MTPRASITANPNPARPAQADAGRGETTLCWTVEGAQEVEVRVGSPDGPLLSRKAGSGSAKTGPWVRDGMVFYLQNASAGKSRAESATLASVVVRFQREGTQTESAPPPPIGRVQFGDLRRLQPISRQWGFDRGLPIDRYYVESFLSHHCDDIRGRVLEIGDDFYTRKFGGEVTGVDVLNVQDSVPGTTIVADLTAAPQVPAATFDCVILTQTLQLIYDAAAAVRTLHRMLKPGGVLLATVPGISQTYDAAWGACWYWNFTPHSAQRLFADRFGSENVAVHVRGNVLAAIAFLEGLSAEELTREELEARGAGYEVSIGVRSVKV